jgi:hypothetical protein
MWQEWKSQETHLLAVVSVCIELIKTLSNCPGLSAFQQIDFTERIYTPGLPPNYIRSVLFDLPKSTSSHRPTAVGASRQEGTGFRFWQYRQVRMEAKTPRIDIGSFNSIRRT